MLSLRTVPTSVDSCLHGIPFWFESTSLKIEICYDKCKGIFYRY